jgi:8-oxo-dGTP diphosphatase
VGEINRDSRKPLVTVACYALVKLVDHDVKAATDAANAAWFSVTDVPKLAFDHQMILDRAVTRLKGKVRYEPVGFELLTEKFALSELQHLYEVCLEEQIDKRNFRKKILGMGLLIETNEIQKDVAHRAARLYRFDTKN